MRKKFERSAELAIQEFKILHDFAPDDPWIHLQLALSYHDLKMPEEELKEYEILLKLIPGDSEVLMKLGMLYFILGQNAQGLTIYDTLKKENYPRADDLMDYYLSL